jgi:hypothetical protein
MIAKVQPFYSNQRRVIHKKLLDNAIEGISCNLVLHTLLHCVQRPVFSYLFLSCVYTELLKGPKLEIFVAGIFAQTRPTVYG